MRRTGRPAAAAAIACLAASSCAAPGQIPSFLDGQHISRIVVSCDQAGTATASSRSDNLNELLNMLNLGDIDISSRRVTPPPTGPRCTARLFDGSSAGPAVLIPYQANGASLYLGAPAAPQHTGTYRLHHAIHIEGLRGFIKKYGH